MEIDGATANDSAMCDGAKCKKGRCGRCGQCLRVNCEGRCSCEERPKPSKAQTRTGISLTNLQVGRRSRKRRMTVAGPVEDFDFPVDEFEEPHENPDENVTGLRRKIKNKK